MKTWASYRAVILFGLITAISLVGIGPASAAPGPKPRYQVTTILPLDESHTVEPWAINNHGDVVGRVHWDDLQASRPFLYRDGQLTVIDTSPANGDAVDINDAGDMVIRTFYSVNRSYLIRADGQRFELVSESGTELSPFAVNNRGEVAAAVFVPQRGFDSVSWSNGVVRLLGPVLTNLSSFPGDINDSGVAAGTIQSTSFEFSEAALLWHGGMTPVGPVPDGRPSIGQALNNHGEMVVNSLGALDGFGRTYLFRAGRLLDLGTLHGHTESFGAGINVHGHVVGASQSGSDRRAFLFVDGTMHDLNDLAKPIKGLKLLFAFAINDRGDIVGLAQLASGASRAFLLTAKQGNNSKP